KKKKNKNKKQQQLIHNHPIHISSTPFSSSSNGMSVNTYFTTIHTRTIIKSVPKIRLKKIHAGNPNIYVYCSGGFDPNPYANPYHQAKFIIANIQPMIASRWAILKRGSCLFPLFTRVTPFTFSIYVY